VAEIGIERSRGTNTWVWVVVALVAVAIIAWLLWPRGDATMQQQQPVAPVSQVDAPVFQIAATEVTPAWRIG
jgi:hypothetical protein